jgi:hypothetical protein
MRKWQLAIVVPVAIALIALGVVFQSFAAAPWAHARSSQWTLVQYPGGPIYSPAGMFCPFALQTVFTVDKEYALMATKPDGTTQLLITGALKVTETNLATGKSIDVNASGPGKTTFNSDGSVTTFATGHGVIVNTPDLQQELGLPGLALLDGQYHETFYPDGTATITYTGHLTDLCASLS